MTMYDVKLVLEKNYPKWMTAEEIADSIGYGYKAAIKTCKKLVELELIEVKNEFPPMTDWNLSVRKRNFYRIKKCNICQE